MPDAASGAVYKGLTLGSVGPKFGNGGAGGDPNTLFFAAGIGGEQHGLFGTIQNVD